MKGNVILYSYKSPNLMDVVQRVLDTTTGSTYISILDQHPLNREKKFEGIDNVSYKHKFWDHIDGPTWFKEETIFNEDFNSEYTLLLSDDTVLKDGWLEECIDFINGNKNVFISGKGQREVVSSGDNFLSYKEKESSNFSISHLCSRMFMFALTKTFTMTGYPRDIKYFGEEESMSIRLNSKDIAMYSAPSNMYQDLGLRTVENLYCPFSLEHNYNSVISLLDTEYGSAWLTAAGVEKKPLPLFDQRDDVLYDPTAMMMNEYAQERFIANTKAIY